MNKAISISAYFDKTGALQAVAFDYEGVTHCTSDVRHQHNHGACIVFSKLTKDGKMLKLMEDCVEVCGYTKITMELEFNVQPDKVYVYMTPELGEWEKLHNEKVLRFFSDDADRVAIEALTNTVKA